MLFVGVRCQSSRSGEDAGKAAGQTGRSRLSKPSQSYLTKGEMWVSRESGGC